MAKGMNGGLIALLGAGALAFAFMGTGKKKSAPQLPNFTPRKSNVKPAPKTTGRSARVLTVSKAAPKAAPLNKKQKRAAAKAQKQQSRKAKKAARNTPEARAQRAAKTAAILNTVNTVVSATAATAQSFKA